MVVGNAHPKIVNNVLIIARTRCASRVSAGVTARCASALALSSLAHHANTFQPRHCPAEWTRGAKRKSFLKLDALPQGTIPVEDGERIIEDEVTEYPTVVQQALDNMRKFNHCVLLTRVGGFYEASPLP